MASTNKELDPDLQRRLLEDSLARDRVLAELEQLPLKIVQTSGSSAGAGSGDFHHYRQYRRAEFARIGAIEREHRKEKEKAEFEQQRLQNEEECAKITAKKSNKRKRKREAAQARKAAQPKAESEEDIGPQPLTGSASLNEANDEETGREPQIISNVADCEVNGSKRHSEEIVQDPLAANGTEKQ